MTDHEAPEALPARLPTLIRIACILLMVLGFGSVAISFSPAADPGRARCRLSRDRVDAAATDKKAWNDVDTGGRKPRDLPCGDAIRLVSQIKLNEKGTRHEAAPSETAVRVQGLLGIVLGLGQGIGGMVVARGLSRAARNAAVAFSAFGLVFPILGPISFAVSFFVIYALVFSAAAKQRWAREGS
jgi:hypothetical protein